VTSRLPRQVAPPYIFVTKQYFTFVVSTLIPPLPLLPPPPLSYCFMLTFWQVYQIVTSSKMVVQVSFSQEICVCKSTCGYLLVLAIMKKHFKFNVK